MTYNALSGTLSLYITTTQYQADSVCLDRVSQSPAVDHQCCCSNVSSDVTTTWRGVLESSDCVGLFNSTFTVSCVDRNTAATRTAKVARTGELCH